MYLSAICLLSVIAWGLVFIDLTKTFIFNTKNGRQHPLLLVPLIITSFALILESIYFGATTYLCQHGYSFMCMSFLTQEYWFIVKFFVAIGGMLFYINLKN